MVATPPNEPPPEGTRLAKWGSWGSGAFASEDKLERVEQLRELCSRHDHSLLDLAMGWLAARPSVASVIAGVTSVEQLEQNVKAGLFRPSNDQLAEVDEISPPPGDGLGPRGR